MDRRLIRSPSATLPALSLLLELSTSDISEALNHIRTICTIISPTPLASNIRSRRKLKNNQDLVPDSGYASAEDEPLDPENRLVEDAPQPIVGLEHIRADTFEQVFVIRWLTGFIKRAACWTCADTGSEAETREALVDDAATLLAACAGGGVGGEPNDALTRVFSFGSVHNGTTVRVELNDAPLSSHDHTSVGLQSWASSIVLARMLCANTAAFSLGSQQRAHNSRKRVLELGAGTGLLSIVAAKVLQNDATKIVATDFHPDVLVNLRQNICTNFPATKTPPIEVHAFDWQFPSTDEPFDVPFDVVLAADVVYHRSHAAWIRDCIARLLAPDGVFWLIIPVRRTGRHEGVGDTVEEEFPAAGQPEANVGGGRTLCVLNMHEVGRSEGVGRADECGYKLFEIGWVVQL